jgi:hypothetical protein
MSAYASDPTVLIASADCELKPASPFKPGPSEALCKGYEANKDLCGAPSGGYFFPCIIYGKGGNLQLYQGDRSFSDLKHFVESHASGPTPPSPPSPAPPSPPTPPSPPSPTPPSPSQCGSCKVCLNPTNHKCQDQGAHAPHTRAACEAKGHIWCGPSSYEVYPTDPVVNATCTVMNRLDESVVV